MTDTPNTTQGKGAFQVGDKVRYIGPKRAGLTSGAIYECIGIGSFNAPIHRDDDGDIRDRTENDYELVSRAPEHPTPTQYAPEMVNRLVAVVRGYVMGSCACDYGPNKDRSLYAEAAALLSDLPQEVDPDEAYAEQLIREMGWAGQAEIGEVAVRRLVAQAYAAGRQLQRGEAA